jgi:hypothetical protein
MICQRSDERRNVVASIRTPAVALLIWRKASASRRLYRDASITADHLMSMHSDTIPSGRAPGSNWAGVAVVATSAGLGALSLLGMSPIVVALIGLGVIGSLLIATDRSIKHEPIAMLV